MYVCRNCDHTFDEPDEVESIETHEFWGAPVAREVVEEQCPFCGSDDIEALETEEANDNEQATA